MKPLTTRETSILELIGRGHSSAEIGYTLNISTNTVETHRKTLLLKFQAKNAAELVRKAIQKNVLSIHDKDYD